MVKAFEKNIMGKRKCSFKYIVFSIMFSTNSKENPVIQAIFDLLSENAWKILKVLSSGEDLVIIIPSISE